VIKKNYQSSNLLNFHAHHLNLWFFCANSSFLLRLIVKFSLVLGLFLNYNYNAFWSILLPLPFIIYLNTFVSYINYIFKYICLLHLFQYICLLHSLYISIHLSITFISIHLSLTFIIYLNTFVYYIHYIFQYICLLHSLYI